ncbi:MAG: carboxypeptidase-like regulatory domain-containing protein [Muribaculaceae bacterium]|nr:carboxypeptidase-like regulatory domain-containing protein [Muribaculaceae bacterium]
MSRGKDICKRLKEVRREIARANDIEYITSECKFKGECTGTCPKCEAEVRYLEEQLSLRHRAGKAIAVAGIAASMFLCYAPASQAATPAAAVPQCQADAKADNGVQLIPSYPAQGETITVNGIVADKDKEALTGALITCNGKATTVTNVDGMFSIEVPRGSIIKVSYIGTEDVTFTVPEDATTNFDAFVIMKYGNANLQGEVVMLKPSKTQKDCIIYNHDWPLDAPENAVEVTIDVHEKRNANKRLKGSVVYLKQGNKEVARANDNGRVRTTVPRGATIIIKTPGYKDVQVKLDRKAKSIGLIAIPFPAE